MNLGAFIGRIVPCGFWGDVTIRFKGGKPVHITKVERFLIDALEPQVASRENHRCDDAFEGEHEQQKRRREEPEY